MRRNISVLMGTRPEAIKLAPVILALRACDEFGVRIVSTGQHKEMLYQVLDVFGLAPDVDLEVMKNGQSLAGLNSRTIAAVESELNGERPDLVIVQGDTTTAFAASLTAFCSKIPIAHVEAGLRSDDMRNPFPEEANRRLVSVLADLHLAPTPLAAEALRQERTPKERIAVTGNTVVDALLRIADMAEPAWLDDLRREISGRRLLVVTSHRRESWGRELENICRGVAAVVEDNPDVFAVFPVHLNPLVREPVHALLGGRERIKLMSPLPYLEFVHLMKLAALILTDSGGVQEEAPTFGAPVLVLRQVTERPEAMRQGQALIVGTDPATIRRTANDLLADSERYESMSKAGNPFGDGRASERIVKALRRYFQSEFPVLRPEECFCGTTMRMN